MRSWSVFPTQHRGTTDRLAHKPIIGVLGGMGPEATVNFLDWVVKLSPCQRDRDHFRLLVDLNPQIPDRTEALVAGAASPLPVLKQMAANLVRQGAEILAMPCNTAHYWFDELVRDVRVLWPNIVEESVRSVRALGTGIRDILVLATEGTVRTELHAKALGAAGYRALIPPFQREVSALISAVKAGDHEQATGLGSKVVQLAVAMAPDAVILACTELPLVIKDMDIPLIDSTRALAEAVVRQATALSAVPRTPLTAEGGIRAKVRESAQFSDE